MNQYVLNTLQTFLKENNCDLAYIQDPASIRLLTNFSSEPHERVIALVVTCELKTLLFVPALEHAAAQKAEPMIPVYSYHDHENPWQLLVDAIHTISPAKTWAVEKEHFSLARFESVSSVLPHVQFAADLTPFFNQARLIKQEHEIQLLHEAGALADLAVEIGATTLKEGISEIEVVAEIEYQLKKRGVTSMSFDTMVLFGDHAADPHGEPGKRRLQKNEWVLFDLGVMHKGYASDTTRMVFFGEKPNTHQQEVFDVVKEAHDLAIQAVKPGVTASSIDKIARDYITAKGYGDYFIHRLGHGIGQSCHEFPSIMEGNDMLLQEGMCFSVEPGIYIAGDIGIRVEDCLVVTKDGAEVFTHSPAFRIIG